MHTSSRLSLEIPDPSDAVTNYPAVSSQQMTELDNALIYMTGTLAGLPAASSVPAGVSYYATDSGIVLFAVGTGSAASQWIQAAFNPGDLKTSAITSAPPGWLTCDGSAVSRSTYSFLYAAIGVAYGAGDGATTFNVPDLRGRVPVGAGTGSGLTARSVGQAGGEETHLLSISEMPSHGHQLNGGAATNWSGSDFNTSYVASGTAGAYNLPGTTQITDTQNTGGGGSHNNMQPFTVMSWFIKA